MRLAAIEVFPVKSTAPVSLEETRVTPTGLAGDREWMVVGPDGDLVSARDEHAMFDVRTRVTIASDDGTASSVVLSAPDRPDLVLQRPDAAPGPITMFGRTVPGVAVSPEADAWLSDVLERPGLRLMWFPPRERTEANFHDDFAISVVTDASIAQLDAWLRDTAAEADEPVPAPLDRRRFRPNLYLEGGTDAFAEDGWTRVRIGDVEFTGLGPIARCVMTTIDPATHTSGKEPIRTMARHRRWDGQTWMCAGLRAVASGPAVPMLRVGDTVEVLA